MGRKVQKPKKRGNRANILKNNRRIKKNQEVIKELE